MKKILSIVLVMIMMLSVVACGGKKINSGDVTTPTATAKTTAKTTAKSTAKSTAKTTAKPTVKPTAKPTATPHTHSYGSWKTISAATCLAEGKQERRCSCGLTESKTLQKTNHNYINGFCSVCGEYDPNKKQEEIDAENKRYERELAEYEGMIDAKTSLLNNRMRNNGISYLYSESECNRKISQLETEINNLQYRKMYATSQSEKLSLQRQIDDKSDELVKYSVMKTLIQDKEEIDELYEYVKLLEIEHHQNIQEINNKYS